MVRSPQFPAAYVLAAALLVISDFDVSFATTTSSSVYPALNATASSSVYPMLNATASSSVYPILNATTSKPVDPILNITASSSVYPMLNTTATSSVYPILNITTRTTTQESPCLEWGICENGGTCQSDGNDSVWCDCPQTIDGVLITEYEGTRCERVRHVTNGSLVIAITPLFGPIAGGTNITVSGTHFDLFPPRMLHIGPFLVVVSEIDTTTDEAYFRSPPVNDSLVGEKLRLFVELDREDEVPVRRMRDRDEHVEFFFTYKGNPQISDIHPLQHISSGGTVLTAFGSNMDAVANPVLTITQIYRFLSSAGPPREFTTNVTVHFSGCLPFSEESILCPMPILNIPKEFLAESQYASPSERRRRRQTVRRNLALPPAGVSSQLISNVNESRDWPYIRRNRRSTAGSSSIPFETENSTLELIIGFELDGYDKFNDISETLPDAKLILFPPPSIAGFNGVKQYYPDDGTLQIKGSGMLNGATMMDYMVIMGLSECAVLNVVDNLLTCAPPSDAPVYHQDDHARCGKDLYAVLVKVGFSENLVGCLKFNDSSRPIRLLYIILGACAAAVLLALVILLFTYLYY